MQITRPETIQPSKNQSVPRHPTKLASQMQQLNAVSMASRPGVYAKLTQGEDSSSHVSYRKKFFAEKNLDLAQQSSIDTAAINISRELPSQIQPIRNIISPKGFFPANSSKFRKS